MWLHVVAVGSEIWDQSFGIHCNLKKCSRRWVELNYRGGVAPTFPPNPSNHSSATWCNFILRAILEVLDNHGAVDGGNNQHDLGGLSHVKGNASAISSIRIWRAPSIANDSFLACTLHHHLSVSKIPLHSCETVHNFWKKKPLQWQKGSCPAFVQLAKVFFPAKWEKDS